MRTLHLRLGVAVDVTEDEERAILSSGDAEALQNAMARGGWRAAWDTYIPGPWIEDFNRVYGTKYPEDDVGIDLTEDDPMGDREFQYLLAFCRESEFDEERNIEWLRMLWTVFCLHRDLDPDTAAYDAAVSMVWEAVEEKDTPEWSDFDSFDFFLARHLV